jgi:hypothetical protein
MACDEITLYILTILLNCDLVKSGVVCVTALEKPACKKQVDCSK